MAITVLIATVLGTLSGLGVGGGSLLMLWLTLVVGMEQTQARVMNLLFFLPSAIIACCFRWRQGRIQKVLPAIVAGSLCAAAGSLAAGCFSVAWLKKLLGILLLFTGAKELFYRPRNAK